jgi:hypothetical protein
MYAYSSLVPMMHEKFRISLPDTVPSFHYFFYLKALQSVFFGMGFVFIFRTVLNYVLSKKLRLSAYFVFPILVIVCAAIYYPYYGQREDFVEQRARAVAKENDKDKVDVYDYFVSHIPEDKVILCEQELSCFPLMASARKMVSNYATFSNPYVNYEKGETARQNMLQYLKAGRLAEARDLLIQFKVSYILVENKELPNYTVIGSDLADIVYRNKSYTLFALKT